ncbi:MAG TPA: ATP-grasp domain-containing protein [Streptosporangiaceae bacterium]|nr:ATP-grasp domain-containing protein [Streptosporangiaceae bacterium]
MAGQIYAVGNAGLAAWLPQFIRPCDQPASITVPRTLAELEAAASGAFWPETVFVSDHQTISRDLEWAALLASRGRAVRCQSETAATAATDKAALKQILTACLIPTLPWRCAGDGAAGWCLPAGPAVVKRRNGTQSEGIRLAPPDAELAAGEYAEPYRDGTEYSVNAFRHESGLTILPTVWKGCTTRALVPPWMRTRLCAPAIARPDVASRLAKLTGSIAAALDADGFFEVEFLATDSGEVYVLEVNPRVSGTLRISALAAEKPVFSWYADPAAEEVLAATAWAVEVPNPGSLRPVVPDLGLYATSRVTVVAADQARLAERIGHIARAGLLAGEAITALHDACSQLESGVDALVPH